jgi:antitoxin CptB
MSEMSRLRWMCRRGMKELDVVLTRYLDHCYESANPADRTQFLALLEMPDPDLYNLLLGRDKTTDPELAQLLQQLILNSGLNSSA